MVLFSVNPGLKRLSSSITFRSSGSRPLSHSRAGSRPFIGALDTRRGAHTNKGGTHMKNKNIGSSFDRWLREEGIYEDVSAAAMKRVLARQLEAAMKEKHFSRAEMAR